MASLSSMVRRSVSSMAPLALRTLRPQNSDTRFAFAAKTTQFTNNTHSLVPRVHFCSESCKHSSDDSLIRVLDEEIKSAKESDQHSLFDELPSGFPFEIEDNPGRQTITLKRTYQDEEVQVVVHMPSLVSGEENDFGNDEDDDEKAMQSSIPLVVKVSKKTGEFSLEFLCTTYGDEISIQSLTFKSKENAGDQTVYEGPDFNDLDENLQKSFLKYLDIRGIKPKTTSFLHEYMIDKDNKEFVWWLQKVKKFIQA